MRTFAKCLGILMLVTSAGCTSDPRDIVITEDNESDLLHSLAEEQGLTVDEVRLLMARELRASASEAIGAEAESVVGKTVGEVIDEERALQDEAAARREQEERLAAAARAREEALAAELRDAILLTVSSKSFVPSAPLARRYDDYITFRVAYENTSDRDIRAFRGRLRFTDLFGTEIMSSGITIQDPVAAGDRDTWAGQIEYNQFNDEHVRLRQTKLNDMRVEWLPASIIFADGTQLGDAGAP